MPTKIRQNACTGLKNMLKLFGKMNSAYKIKRYNWKRTFFKNDNEQHIYSYMCCLFLSKKENERSKIMPKTKFQDLVYTIIMVIVMVYAMICYNIAIGIGGMNNNVFLMAFGELPIMGIIAFLLEFLFIGKITQKIAFKILNPKETQPIFIILTISSLIVCFMCPLMSFFVV